EWLELAAEKIKNEGFAPGSSGEHLRVDYNNCVKIAVLHHHPVDFLGEGVLLTDAEESARRLRLEADAVDEWTLLENRERFLKACYSAAINMVLFGHQHSY